MGEPQNPHFYDFRTFERVLSSPNHLFLSWETPGHLKQIKKNPHVFAKSYFYKSQNVGNLNVLTISEKAGVEKSRRSV